MPDTSTPQGAQNASTSPQDPDTMTTDGERARKRSRWEDMPEDEVPMKPKSIKKVRGSKPTRRRRDETQSDSPDSTPPRTAADDEKPAQLAVRATSWFVPPRTSHPPFMPCRSVHVYERLNHIEEGSYGVVYRARDKETGEIVALKKLKLDEEKQGFPITSLREIMALMVCRHENVVGIREIVVGNTLTQVYIVMDFIEHDLKTLLATMPQPFLQSEIKTLLRQLLSAVAHCHANWVLHRDLKTSNLLMNNRGTIKVADFGLARKFGDPLGDMTQLVVTLWYRAPELLFGETTYSTAIDVWSVGCVFGELLLNEPVFQAKSELEMLGLIFKLLGSPTEESWPGFSKLPLAKTINVPVQPYSNLRTRFRYVSQAGLDLLSKLLTYDPAQRISAEEAINHPYFSEAPLPKHPDLFSSFPSLAAGEKKPRLYESPSAPHRQEYEYV
ncbi:hypothetical protein FRC03_012361 [Tulasnella sp. 419]|nr:hypothetical protein FRC02_006980 [Tulasnella sp. 418]KAG8966171.1 hypothetical protein FRC03_012361 [Tulasnella sp. 419]